MAKRMKILMRRRDFVVGVAAASLGACGGEDPLSDAGAGPDTMTFDSSIDAAETDSQSQNADPVWEMIPALQFVVGVPATLSIADYVEDPDGDALSFMLNEVSLPPGVSFDAGVFSYDGVGAAVVSEGHVIIADDAT